MLAKVAKTCCRADQFQNGITSSVNFNNGCQDILLVVHQLISLILYGPNIHGAASHTQPTKTLSQLVVHNAKKKDHSRHFYELLHFTEERATSASIYIHATAKDKKMIENFEQLGISYDRVLQLEPLSTIEPLSTRNLCDQFKKDNIVCPPQLREGIVAVGAIKNLDRNHSLTTAQFLFHSKAISITTQSTSYY